MVALPEHALMVDARTWHEPLDPDPHEPEPLTVQPEGVVQRDGGLVDLLGDVGRLRQGAGAVDGAEVGVPDGERDTVTRRSPGWRPLRREGDR